MEKIRGGAKCEISGVFAKAGGKTWCFDGQFVVGCVVNVVVWMTNFER
jgi:hypothetical protein